MKKVGKETGGRERRGEEWGGGHVLGLQSKRKIRRRWGRAKWGVKKMLRYRLRQKGGGEVGGETKPKVQL